jgi:hypothetical protein
MSRSAIEEITEGIDGSVREVIIAVYDVFTNVYVGLHGLVRSFYDDLSMGVMEDVDEYYNEAASIASSADEDYLNKFSEKIAQNPTLLRILPGSMLARPRDALNKLASALASALFMVACRHEGPRKSALILLGYSYIGFAGGITRDAMIFMLAAIALARSREDIATELLKKIGFSIDGIIEFACGAVAIARMIEAANSYGRYTRRILDMLDGVF